MDTPTIGTPVQYHPNGFEVLIGRPCYPAIVTDNNADEQGRIELLVFIGAQTTMKHAVHSSQQQLNKPFWQLP